jgi:hypothetical protein
MALDRMDNVTKALKPRSSVSGVDRWTPEQEIGDFIIGEASVVKSANRALDHQLTYILERLVEARHEGFPVGSSIEDGCDRDRRKERFPCRFRK